MTIQYTFKPGAFSTDVFVHTASLFCPLLIQLAVTSFQDSYYNVERSYSMFLTSFSFLSLSSVFCFCFCFQNQRNCYSTSSLNHFTLTTQWVLENKFEFKPWDFLPQACSMFASQEALEPTLLQLNPSDNWSLWDQDLFHLSYFGPKPRIIQTFTFDLSGRLRYFLLLRLNASHSSNLKF